MKNSSFIWQCKCGHLEYKDDQPEDCPKCFRVNKFDKIPEDMIEEKSEEEILSMYEGGEDED